MRIENDFVAVAFSSDQFVFGEDVGWDLRYFLLASPKVPAAYYQGDEEDACDCYAGDCAAAYAWAGIGVRGLTRWRSRDRVGRL
jgi:hypothetical protein